MCLAHQSRHYYYYYYYYYTKGNQGDEYYD